MPVHGARGDDLADRGDLERTVDVVLFGECLVNELADR